MGNCVGQTGRKISNKNVRNAKNKQDSSEYTEATLSNKPQQANKKELNPAVTGLNTDNENGNKRSERHYKNIFEDPERAAEPIAGNCKNSTSNGNEPIADNTTNNETPQADNINSNWKAEISNEEDPQSRKKHRTVNTKSDPNTQDNPPIDVIQTTRKTPTQEQCLTESERISKLCDENDVETSKECLDFNKENISEKKSSFIDPNDCKKSSADNVNIIDNIETSSTMSSKSTIEFEKNAKSFEKLVLSACFSENVRKAFVVLSEDFIKPQDDVKSTKNNMDIGTEIIDEGEIFQEESTTFTENFSENEGTGLNRHSKYFIEPQDVKCTRNEMDIGTEITEKGQPLQEELSNFTQCFSEHERTGFFQHSTDLVDPEENVGPFDDGLDIVNYVPDKGLSMDKDSPFTGCFSEMEETGFSKHITEFIEVEDCLVSSLTTHDNELDMANDVSDKEESLNKDAASTGCSSMLDRLSFRQHSTDFIDFPDDLLSASITNKKFDTDKQVTDKVLPLNDDSVSTDCYSEREESGFSNHSTDVIDLGDLLSSSSTSENELGIDDEDSALTECCSENQSAEIRVIDHKIEDRTNEDKLESVTENISVISIDECLFDISEDTMLYEIVSSSIRNENELAKGKNILDKEKHSDKDSAFIGCCSRNETTKMQGTNECMYESFNIHHETESIDECSFDICEESTLYAIVSSSTRNEYELNMDKDAHGQGLILKEDSAFTTCCSENSTTEMGVIVQEDCTIEESGIFESFNLDLETKSDHECLYDICDESTLYEIESFNLGQGNDECLSDICEDSAMYETLSYCKIDTEASCECFEEVDMNCCCQCCECIGNHE